MAGGKSFVWSAGCVAPTEIMRGPAFVAVVAADGVELVAAVWKGSCGEIVRVAFGMTVLLNRSPGAIERGTLAAQTQPALLQTGVPGQLLRNRPDVQEAEAAYRAYFEQTNAARAYFYPLVHHHGQWGPSEYHYSGLVFAQRIVWYASRWLTPTCF